MLNFELLRAFVAVADCGGFHRAAERLSLTQSTVSQQIKRLELETKRPLFRRTTRSVALTDDGEMLLGDARRLLQFEEAARHRLAAPRLSGTARLGVVEEVAGGSLPPALGRFAKLHPGVKLEVQIGVSGRHVRSCSGCGAAAGPVSRAIRFSRGCTRRAQRQRTELGDHLYQPQFDRRARGGARGPRHHPASCQRADRGLAHSRCRRGAAAAS
jgi:DNA-binding transcriptional LysR family regulator